MDRRERWGFTVAGFGQNVVFNLVNIYMLVYLVGGVGLQPSGIAKVTGLLTAAKIWDAINDLMAGVIVDRTRTRWGRFRPYVLFMAAPIALFTALMFHVPAGSENSQVVFFALVYVVWSMLYTLSDVPFWSLITVITVDDRSRNGLIGAVRAANAVALALITLAGAPLARLLSFGPETTGAGWGRTAILVAVVGMGLFTLGFFTTTEKTPPSDKPLPLGQSLRLMATNTTLARILVSGALGFGRFLIQVGGAVMALVVFGDEQYFTLLGAALIVAMLVATLVTPLVLRRVTRRDLMVWSSAVSGVVYFLMWLAGYRSLPVVMVLVFVTGLMMGVFMVTQTAMIGDAADHGEVRTGERNDGVCFAGLTFLGKLDNALATILFGLVLAGLGYSKGVTVTPAMRDGVWAVITLPPALSCLASIVPLLRYKVPEREMPALLAEVRAGRTPSPSS